MPAQIITTDDLREFKTELIEELKKLFRDTKSQPAKQWLKSPEVLKLLNISPGTLQNMRVNGTLPFTRIGGVIYYQYEDIQQMLQSSKNKSRN